MYKLFCKNLKIFIDINKNGDFTNEFRLKITRPLIVMADLDLYNNSRSNCTSIYKEICNLVFEIESNSNTYPSFKAFSWELWGYDLDNKSYCVFPKEIVSEQLKLIDLLLSCHYWVTA